MRWSSHPLTSAQAFFKCRKKEKKISTCLIPKANLKSRPGLYSVDIPGRLINFHLAASEEKRTIGTHIEEQRSEVKSRDNERLSDVRNIQPNLPPNKLLLRSRNSLWRRWNLKILQWTFTKAPGKHLWPFQYAPDLDWRADIQEHITNRLTVSGQQSHSTVRPFQEDYHSLFISLRALLDRSDSKDQGLRNCGDAVRDHGRHAVHFSVPFTCQYGFKISRVEKGMRMIAFTSHTSYI